MKKELIDPYFNNLFSILSPDKDNRLFEKKSVLISAKETGVDKEQLKLLYNSWVAGGREIMRTSSAQDDSALVYWLCAGLLYDEAIHKDSLMKLIEIAGISGITPLIVNQVIRGRARFSQEKSLKKRFTLITKAAENNSLRTSGKKDNNTNKGFYIANQVCLEGLDELQRLLLASGLGLHAALDGPPGVGKTRSVMEISSILDRDLYTKTCSSRTTESHIISHPVLTMQDGVSVTSHVNGPLTLAMDSPGIFYGDEFNLLKEDVQKRLNSAFDDRRYIDRNDGVQIDAKAGFWSVISYNPARNMISRDLEDSVADRFIHLHYSRWPSDFKAYVSLKSAEGKDPAEESDHSSFNINLGWRGISKGTQFFRGIEDNGKLKWLDFFTGNEYPSRPEYIYRVYDRGSIMASSKFSKEADMKSLESQAFSPVDFSRLMSRFTEMLHSLATTGQSPMLAKIGLSNILQEEDLELLVLHESSTRIEIAALKHYDELVKRGFNRFLAQSYATRLVIDQICYGQYRDKRLRNTTVYEIVSRIAQSLKLLFGSSTFNTDFKAETVLSKTS